MKKYVVSNKYKYLYDNYDNDEMTLDDYSKIGIIILKDKIRNMKIRFKKCLRRK